jgi:hypothetical protein
MVKKQPLPLHEHVVRSVDHHLGHRRILQQELDRSEPDDIIGNLVHDPREVARRKDGAAFAQDRHRFLADTQPPLGRRRGGEPARVDPLPELIPELATNQRQRVPAHEATSTASAGVSRMVPASRSNARPIRPRGGERRP